jgi:radical SAM-linked protein
MVRQRVRIRFRKQGDLRLVGHRDLVRSMERLFRRAGLRLGRSEGFHPKPRMSFPSALALGIEGLDEVTELELAESWTPEGLLERLRAHAVPGLTFHRAEILPPGAPKARIRGARYQVPIPADRRAEVAGRVSRLLGLSSCWIDRPSPRGPVDVRRSLEELTFREGVLAMRLSLGPRASAGPRDVLRALELGDLEQGGAWLVRTTVELEA